MLPPRRRVTTPGRFGNAPLTSKVLICFNARSLEAPTASLGPAFRLEQLFRGPGARRGTLFASGDPDGLAAAVLDTLRRPDPARTERARQHAARFDWSRVGGAVEAVYRAACAGAYPSEDERTG